METNNASPSLNSNPNVGRRPSLTSSKSGENAQQPPTPTTPSLTRSKLHTIESADDWANLLKSGTVLAYFTNAWCPPCRMIEPKFAACAEFYPGIAFVKIDTDDFSEIAMVCEVEYTPTFQFYRNGAKFDEYVGSDAEQLRSQIAVAAAGQGEVNGENTTE